MDRRTSDNETRPTPPEQGTARSEIGARQRTEADSAWQEGQPASPRKRTRASDQGRRLAFDRLYQEMLENVSEQVEKREPVCRAVRRLWMICRSCPDSIEHLSDLFDVLRASEERPEFDRLATILDQRLAPLIRRHFREDEQVLLERTLKTLVVLRTLGLPYRPKSPIPWAEADDLLAALERLCDEDGLMTWCGSDGEPVYVVERDVERFVDWLIARLIAFLGPGEREKALSDALWSTLATEEQTSLGGATIEIGVATFAGKEAVLVQHPELGTRVLVFESLWKEDRGRRTRRVLSRLPVGIPLEHVWIWVPASLNPEGSEQVTCYVALARALREIGDEAQEAVVSRMSGLYLRTCAPALRTIVDGYRRGKLVTERGTWRPDGQPGSFVSVIRQGVAWATRERRILKSLQAGTVGGNVDLTKG